MNKQILKAAVEVERKKNVPTDELVAVASGISSVMYLLEHSLKDDHFEAFEALKPHVDRLWRVINGKD